MPNYQKTVDIIFGGKDNVSPVVKSLAGNLNQLDTAVQGIARPLGNLADKTLTATSALTTMAGVMIGISLNEAKKFQSSFNEISTLFDASGDNIQKFQGDIFNYAKGSTQSIQDINSSIYSAISAGADYKDSIELLNTTEKLAVGGKTDLNSATVLLLSTLNAYGASVDQAEQYSDSLFKTVQLGQTTIPELASSLAQVTSIAANAGVSFDEVSASLAALTGVGLPTSQAVTTLKAVISGIVSPSQQAKDAAKALGIEFSAQSLKAKGLEGILNQVLKATGGNKDEMLKLFGRMEAVTGVFALTGLAADKFADALDGMANKAGSTEGAFAKMVNNVELQTQKLKNNLQLVFIQSGNQILDSFGQNIGSLSGVFAALGDSIKAGAFDDIFNLLNQFGGDIDQVLQSISKNLSSAFQNVDFTNLIRAFQDLGSEVGDLFGSLVGDIDLTTVDGLSKGLQNVVNIITVLVNVTQGIVSQFEPIFAGIGEASKRVGTAGQDAQVAGGQFLGVMKLLSDFGTILGGALTIINASGTEVARVFDFLAGSIKILVNGAQVAFDGIAYAATKTAQSLNQALATVTFGDTSSYYKNQAIALNELGDAIQANLVRNSLEAKAGLDQISGALSGVSDESEKAGTSTGKATSQISAASQKIKDALASAETTVKGLNDETLILGLSTEELAKATEKFGDNFDVVDGKVVPLMDKISGATDKAKNATQGLQTTTANLPAVYDQAGNKINDFSDGLKGIQASYKKVADQTKEATEKSDEFLTKMEQIASNERIKVIEAAVKLDIAKLDADAKKVETIFKSIDNTISSTGEVIAAAFGTLADFKGIGRGDLAFQTLTDQLAFENEIRKNAAEQQKELISKEIALLEKKIKFFGENGTGIIQVEATNLEPHLESIWYELMKVIQLRATEDGAEFLLGI